MKIILTSASNSFFINGMEYQKGVLPVNYRIPGLIYIGGLSAKLEDIECDGEIFDTLEELQTWISANVFSSGGGSGEGLQWPDTSWQPVAGKVAVFSEQGLLSTGIPEFPENAVPLVLLDIRIPEPPTTGNYRLRSVNGIVSWIAE